MAASTGATATKALPRTKIGGSGREPTGSVSIRKPTRSAFGLRPPPLRSLQLTGPKKLEAALHYLDQQAQRPPSTRSNGKRARE